MGKSMEQTNNSATGGAMSANGAESTDRERAFIDTNVLAHIVGDTATGRKVLEILMTHNFEVVTFVKCVYELYSMVKGTTRGGWDKGNHPLKKLIPSEVNDIAQRLFKTMPNIDPLGNTYYWYNFSEEWQGWEFFESREDTLKQLLAEPIREEAQVWLEKQKEFTLWKQGMRSIFRRIDAIVEEKGIVLYRYDQVFSSDWYMKHGYSYKRDLSEDSLLPNEDFEIVLAALFLRASVFITEDDKDLIWRSGLSLGRGTQLTFCHPESLMEAIADDFIFRSYRKKKA
jgi:hypothetical protein